jgi:ornithine decarboxylase
MAEPGRYPVADVETLHTEVMLVGNRDIDARLWVHVGCGVFGGLAETRGESMVDIVLAGPTCDSADIVYETAGYRSPASLAPGDVVRIASTGAYTAGYSAIGFNGFAPLRQVHDACQLPKSNPRSGALSIGR